jgi:hypothetical protein
MNCKQSVSLTECQQLTQTLTSNEGTWIEFLRLLTDNADPPVTLRGVQALRLALNDTARWSEVS